MLKQNQGFPSGFCTSSRTRVSLIETGTRLLELGFSQVGGVTYSAINIQCSLLRSSFLFSTTIYKISFQYLMYYLCNILALRNPRSHLHAYIMSQNPSFACVHCSISCIACMTFAWRVNDLHCDDMWPSILSVYNGIRGHVLVYASEEL